MSGRGFTALIAEPGMGKTTLLFDCLAKTGNSTRTVFLFQPQLTPRDLLCNLLDDLGIDHEASDVGQMQRELNEYLMHEIRAGKQFVVVIDEAQNLDQNVLEILRMLSNFETPRDKLIHLVLSGQPALAETLASPPLVQLRQRISIIASLQPLNLEETRLYIDHRLRVAGHTSHKSLFTKGATEAIFRHSHGIPRNINNLCFNAMSLGFTRKMKAIDVDVIWEVVRDLDLSSLVRLPSEMPLPDTPKAKKSNRPAKTSVSNTVRARRFSGWGLRAVPAMGLTAAMAATLILHYQRPRPDHRHLFGCDYLHLFIWPK
jgi:general secretion pathway protein A